MQRIVADRWRSRYGAARKLRESISGSGSPDRQGCATSQQWRDLGSGDPREGTPIRILKLALLLILGCTVPAGGPEPDTDPQLGVPIGRSTRLRSGHFTYHLGSIQRNGDDLRVGLRFSNGTHRNYESVMLRVILFGNGGQIRTVRLPVGAVLAEQTKPVVARFEDVTFRLQDVTLELIFALP